MSALDVVEAGIAQLRAGLEAGRFTAEQLVEAYLERIEAYDRTGIRLNALVVLSAVLAIAQFATQSVSVPTIA